MANLGRPPVPAPARGEDAPTVTVFAFDPKAAKGEEASAAWSVELLRSDLAVIDAETGSVRRIVSNQKTAGYWVSPDGSRVTYMVHRGFRVRAVATAALRLENRAGFRRGAPDARRADSGGVRRRSLLVA
jgi:hypothetical protein